jgi:hypothetical protein
MLCAGEQAGYISEPLNLLHRPGIFAAPIRHWYTYICPSNEDAYLAAFRQTLSYRYSLARELQALRSLKDWGRMIRDSTNSLRFRVEGRRPLLKDPFAVFSAAWFAERLGCQVVITVRHPAAFASSLKRLGWAFDFNSLLEQPLLMEELLEPLLDETSLEQMRQAARQSRQDPGQADILAQAGLLWRVIYQVVQRRSERQADWRVVRHEDLSREPVKGYQALYTALDLDFSAQAEETILRSSSSENPSELAQKQQHATRLDSQAAVQNWKRRLTPPEISLIRRLTEDVAAHFYPNLDWEA